MRVEANLARSVCCRPTGTKSMNEKKKEKRWKEWASKPVACAASLVNLKQCRAATLCQQEKQLMLGAAGKGQRTGGVHDRQDGDHCHFKLLNLVGMQRAAA